MNSPLTLPSAQAAAFDEAKAEAFGERMMAALNDAAFITMTSIGHRTGLFDTISTLPPSTSGEIAEAAGLDERYVREWLAVMVTSRAVTYDPKAKTYYLPPEHAMSLTRSSPSGNIAVTAQMVTVAARVEDTIIERFRQGGGTQYCDYHRFHEVMAEDSGQTVVAALFDHILPLVPGLEEKLDAGIEVADVGCGLGRAMQKLAARFPKSRFTGFDLCADAVEQAMAEAAAQNLSNLTFLACDLSAKEKIGPFDLVTAFDAVHDQKDPQGLLDMVARSLKPGGTFLMQDIAGSSYLEMNMDHPLAPFIYSISTLHCMPVSLGQGGPGLGTMWGEELAAEMLKKAGFTTLKMDHLEHDPFNVYVTARK